MEPINRELGGTTVLRYHYPRVISHYHEGSQCNAALCLAYLSFYEAMCIFTTLFTGDYPPHRPLEQPVHFSFHVLMVYGYDVIFHAEFPVVHHNLSTLQTLFQGPLGVEGLILFRQFTFNSLGRSFFHQYFK